MVAIVVFAVVASGVAVAMGTSLNVTRNNKNRSVAANLASVEMDELRSTDFQTLVPGSLTSTQNVDGLDYSIQQDLEWVSQTATTGACDAPGGSKPAYLRATVLISWPNMSGAKPVKSQTIMTPPVGAYDPASGHIAVKVIDAAGAPADGHSVTISGPGGSSSQTTVDGCAFFAYLDAGSYSVSLGTAGYVDRQGNNTPSQTATVNLAQTTSIVFDYDQASTLQLTLGQDGGGHPVLGDFPVTLYNSALLPTGYKLFTGAGSARTISGLFPFPNGYGVWVGDCIDNDPEGRDGFGAPLYAAGVRQVAPASPGQTTSMTVNMKLVDVFVEDSFGFPLVDAPVNATHPSDGQCGAYDVDLGLTVAPNVVQTALPYGAWTFISGTGSTPQVLDPTASDPTTVDVQRT
jgi:hypothetical protein